MANPKHTPSERPIKPWPDFPLFPHRTRRWAKKIGGKTHYFGPWNDPDGAYQRYLARQGSQKAVETPAAKSKAKAAKSKAKEKEIDLLDRPTRPWPRFPLFPHRSGQWAKKIRGEFHYFGTDAQAAFNLYQSQKADLEAGRTPKPTGDYHLNVKDMVNLCLTLKETKVETGELGRRTYKEYQRCGRRLMRVLGREELVQNLGPTDFLKLRRDMTKSLKSLTSIKADIRKIMVFFNFAYKEGYIDRPVRPGDAFKTPSAAALRREREKKADRMFQAEQIRAMIDKANPQLKAMILLGINCAFGNTDCALITKSKLDLDGGWVNYARPKTGVHRRCPLWKETVDALRIVVAQESKYAEYKNRVFYVGKRKPEADHIDDGRRISKYFRMLLDSLGIPDDSPNFYALRHTFVTVALQTRDREAIRSITGHGPNSSDMLETYNEADVADDRKLAVSNYVHGWLFKKESPSSAVAADAEVDAGA